MVSQNLLIPSTSSSLVLGLTSRCINSFNSCHKFSITLLWSRNSFPWSDVCFKLLSCIKRWLDGYTCWMNGSRILSNMLVYRNLSMIPSKIQIWVLPCLLMPAHTWTFTGCLALYMCAWNQQMCIMCSTNIHVDTSKQTVDCSHMYNVHVHAYTCINLLRLRLGPLSKLVTTESSVIL